MVSTLYVGNLPWSIRAEDLKDKFSEYGEVISTRVIMDRETGRSRGFGFVEANPNDAEKIIAALNGTELDGRVINVSEAKGRND